MNSSVSIDDFIIRAPFVSDELLRMLQIALIIPINCCVSLTGVITNLFNIVILTKLGFRHSMSIGTMALSATDFFVSSLQLGSEVSYILHYTIGDSWIDFLALSQIAIGWTRYAGIYISGWITAIIALERCFCVVFPFHVKQICTKYVYILVLVSIYSVYISLVIPIYVAEKMVWLPVYSNDYNSSEHPRYVWTVLINEEAAQLEILFDTVGVSGFALFSQFSLLFCTAYMTFTLKASSRIRKSCTIPYPDLKPQASAELNSSKRTSFLTRKEKRLVRVAVWLAVIMLTCNIPRYIVIAIFSTLPGMHAPDNISVAFFMYDVSDVFANVNCLGNFFVYVKLNYKFRTMFNNFINKRCALIVK
ncbi:neuromedin-U receptor 2 [Biomphalaria glabrata]|nr:neuromedin-U receptor 2-like [Biomphalaria glabrata]